MTSAPPAPGLLPYDAILLTGGRARRMAGIDKGGLMVGGQQLALRVAASVDDAQRLIVVGPTYPGLRATAVLREDPPGGGPVAALSAGLTEVTAPLVALLACDLPFITAAAVAALRAALAAEHDAAAVVPVDHRGRDQPLSSLWRSDALRSAVVNAGAPAGLPLHRVVAAAATVLRLPALAVDITPSPWSDIDTPEDLEEAERKAAGAAQALEHRSRQP